MARYYFIPNGAFATAKRATLRAECPARAGAGRGGLGANGEGLRWRNDGGVCAFSLPDDRPPKREEKALAEYRVSEVVALARLAKPEWQTQSKEP